MTAVVAVVALVVAAVSLFGCWRSARAAAALQDRVTRLEQEVQELVPVVDLTRRETEAAFVAARLAKQAVGIEDPPPRLAAEAVAGPVVRVVAFGAGARRALARFASDITPMARTRASTAKLVGAATRVASPAKRKRKVG